MHTIVVFPNMERTVKYKNLFVMNTHDNWRYGLDTLSKDGILENEVCCQSFVIKLQDGVYHLYTSPMQYPLSGTDTGCLLHARNGVFTMQETFTHFNPAISCIFDSPGTTRIHHNWRASALQRKLSVLFLYLRQLINRLINNWKNLFNLII